MRICIIGPGVMPIPPTGWGAVEILIWDQKLALEKLGHEVLVINIPDQVQIIKAINDFRPDFVQVQYDDLVTLTPFIQYACAITSHFGYLEQPNRWDYYGPRVAQKFNVLKPNVFCLSSGIRNTYQSVMNFPENKLFVTPNGVNLDNFRTTSDPEYPDRSIYLAKVDHRKRQHIFQSIDSLWYAGNIADNRFDTNRNYLGEWSKETLYNDLTEYGNLVLLSDGEAHPLVCLEAMAAGLGVVVSEYATANLDTSKGFISVIPESKIYDTTYIESVITENREYSVQNRKEVLEYVSQFEWSRVVNDYHIPAMNKLIEEHRNR